MTLRPFARIGLGLTAVGLLMAGCARTPSLEAAAPSDPGVSYIPNQLIVKYKAGPAVQDLGRITPDVEGAVHAESVGFDGTSDLQLIQLPKGADDAAALSHYQADPRVEWVQQNYNVDVRATLLAQSATNDPMSTAQWHLDKIGAPAAWAHTTGTGVVVAVLDTGVDYTHPDLAGQIINGPDYAVGDNDPKDKFGHGTHVAGIIVAKANNGIGVAGVAPGAKVLNIEVLNASGGGSIFAIAKGIKYAADYGKKHGVHVVISMSLGGPAIPDPIDWLAGKYAKYKGALLVAAAGNSNGPVGTPARLSDYLAVAATGPNDEKAPFSNFGDQVAVAAPGVDILSTMPTYHVPLNDFKNKQGVPYARNYAALSGTSMATPIVSGVAALAWSAHPDWTADEVRQRLETTAHDLGAPGRDPIFGFGRIDAASAAS